MGFRVLPYARGPGDKAMHPQPQKKFVSMGGLAMHPLSPEEIVSVGGGGGGGAEDKV